MHHIRFRNIPSKGRIQRSTHRIYEKPAIRSARELPTSEPSPWEDLLMTGRTTDAHKAYHRMHDKIYRKAENLVKTGEEIEKEDGVPIIDKRTSVTPESMIVASAGGDPMKYAKTLDKAAKAVGANLIGGYSALVQKGFAKVDEELIRSIPEAHAVTERLCSSAHH
jgi:Uncharacterized conserved protein